jgi:histidinol-phosphate aminotransferase
MKSRIRKSVQALSPYVPGEQPKDSEIIKLNTNENPYPPSPKVQEALAQLDIDGLRRYPDPLCSGLRKALGERYDFSPEQIIVGNGSDELLLLCIRAFVEAGGSVGFFDPSYSLYPVLSAIENVQTKPVPLGPDFGWAMPEDYSADLFLLTNPNAPTSLLFDKDRVREFCETFDGVVVIDEAYVDFSREHCLDLAESLDNVICMRTLSKFASLAFIRCGFALGPAPLIEALYKIKDSYNVNGLTQAVALAALSDTAYLDACVQKVIATRTRVHDAFVALGLDVMPSEANFLWVNVGPKAEAVYQHLRSAKIMVRYFPGSLTGEYLRITIGSDAEMDGLLDVWPAVYR